MRYLIIISFLISSLYLGAFGQNRKFQLADKSEIELINDFSSTMNDSSLPLIVSSLIVAQIDTTLIDLHKMISNYEFSINQFSGTQRDTLLLQKNKYFEVINPDSLIKFKNSDGIIYSGDSMLIVVEPLLFYLEKLYHKKAVCYFHKPIFSLTGTYAILEYWIYCGSLCGEGEIVLMKKINGKWIRIDTLEAWES